MCGALHALRRTLADIALHREVPHVPQWITCLRMDVAIHAAELALIVPRLARLEVDIAAELRVAIGGTGGDASGPEPGDTCEDAEFELHTPQRMLAVARLLLGACCEAHLALVCARRARPRTRPACPHELRATRRMYRDSCLVAVWTSAHAQYLMDLADVGMALSDPSLHTVPSEPTELSLADVYSRRLCPGACASAPETKQLMLMLSRCTNPGSRGWDTLVRSALERSSGTTRICINATIISLTGMHSAIHPALRLHWKRRGVLISALSSTLTASQFAADMAGCLTPFKECIRRMTCNCVSDGYAMWAALVTLKHPLALMHASPLQMPCAGIEGSCAAFADAGKAFLVAQGRVSVAQCINDSFAAAVSVAADTAPYDAVAWTACYGGRGTAAVHQKARATTLLSALWNAAFRCHFYPFWAHSAVHGARATRLDSVQHAVIHGRSAAIQLTLLLSDDERMRINRRVLATPDVGIMNISEAAALLGIPGVRGLACIGGSRSLADSLSIIGSAGPRHAAELLCLGRLALIMENVLVCELGPQTTRRQALALSRRYAAATDSDADDASHDPVQSIGLLPSYATTLYACIQCQRVVNAHASYKAGAQKRGFYEFGTMACMDCLPQAQAGSRASQLRCAKRTSASLRTAILQQDDASTRQIEQADILSDAVTCMTKANGGSINTSIATRVRRDAAKSMQQTARCVPCGSQDLLAVPILGKAVRLWGVWYALCAYCGSCHRVCYAGRIGSELCCMCCTRRSKRPEASAACEADSASTRPHQHCRFCGKVDLQRSGAAWKVIRAPLDATGENARLPPPLRTVCFCPQHYRQWIPACLRTMPMRVVLPHIALNAQPVYDAHPLHLRSEADESKPARLKKRRRLETKMRQCKAPP